MAGILAAARESNATVVPSLHYVSTSGGPVQKNVVDDFLDILLSVYDKEAPFDGVFLDLHGATEIVGAIDGCGYILETIREHVEEKVVIAHASDLHANISANMVENADAIAGYQTYPHQDFYETGYRAAKLGLRILEGKPLFQACVRVPMIVPCEGYSTDEGCFAELVQYAHSLVSAGEILDFSIYQMQPWLDLKDAGSTVLVAAEDRAVAAQYAQELAHRLFDMRGEMQIHLYPIDEVIDKAKSNDDPMPVILVDSADSPNAGSSADSSFVLSRLLERGENIRTCMVMADEAAVFHAFSVGVGNEGEFSLGGTNEPKFQKAIKVHAYVKSLHDGIYRIYSSEQNGLQNAGKSAVLQIGNIDVVVYSKMGLSSDPQTYYAFGIDPAHYRLVMVKSATQFKLPFSSISTISYPTDTPGSSTANLASLPFEKINRPFYPLDNITTFCDTVAFL